MWLRRTSGLLAGSVVTLACLWGLYWLVVSTRLQKGTFERRLSESLGIAIEMDKVSLDWRGRILLDGLRLSTPKGRLALGSLGQAVAEVEKIPLLRGELKITDLTLDQLHLDLSSPVYRELSRPGPATTPQPPRASPPRPYPIRLVRGNLQFRTPEDSFSFGPINASFPAREGGPEVYQLSLGQNTVINVTVQNGDANFTVDSRGGDGLPEALARPLTPEDRLHVQGQLIDGELRVESQIALRQVEGPLQVTWSKKSPERVQFRSPAVKLQGLPMGSAEGSLELSHPARLDFALQGTLDFTRPEAQETEGPGASQGGVWKATGWLAEDGSLEARGETLVGLSVANWQGELKFEGWAHRDSGQGPVLLSSRASLSQETLLQLAGQMGPWGDQLELQGHLDELDLARVPLTTARSTPLQGKLQGDVRVHGRVSSAELSFRGKVHNMAVRGINLGLSEVEVQAGQALRGQLTFANPVDAAALGGPSAAKGLLKVAGARLSGTPSQPRVDPILQFPPPTPHLPGGTGDQPRK